jgi:hypothetical protein
MLMKHLISQTFGTLKFARASSTLQKLPLYKSKREFLHGKRKYLHEKENTYRRHHFITSYGDWPPAHISWTISSSEKRWSSLFCWWIYLFINSSVS